MLDIVDLTKHYGQITALDGATFTARPGRLLGFLGPNGAGKTTAMRCIFGLVIPERGQVHWRGAEIDRSVRLRLGYMPEQRGLYPRMKVLDQLSYFAQQHGMTARDGRAAGSRWLERLGLADRATSKLEDLSHGNQQRVQLAVALVHDPELLVLDEPFSGLDPIGIATMTEVLRERAAAGVGVIFSSHQLDLVENVCQDVVIISHGRIVARGPIDELKATSGQRHLDVEVDGSDGAWVETAVDRAEARVIDRRGDRVRLLVPDSVNLEVLLSKAARAGRVRRFSFEPPALSEIFMDVIDDHAGGSVAPSASDGAARAAGAGSAQ